MPLDSQKSASYLRYRRSLSGLTYAKISELTGIPGATLSAYFNGTVQSPNADTFARLAGAVGGSVEEYDEWTPAVSVQPLAGHQEGVDDVKLLAAIDSIRQAFEANAARMEAAYNASIARLEAAHKKTEDTHRNEKYVLFVLLLLVSVYAIFAFTHYDLPDPTAGLTSLF